LVVFIDNLFIECSHHDTGKQAHDRWVYIAARENFQGRYKKNCYYLTAILKCYLL